jgi:hypothetical protein
LALTDRTRSADSRQDRRLSGVAALGRTNKRLRGIIDIADVVEVKRVVRDHHRAVPSLFWIRPDFEDEASVDAGNGKKPQLVEERGLADARTKEADFRPACDTGKIENVGE